MFHNGPSSCGVHAADKMPDQQMERHHRSLSRQDPAHLTLSIGWMEASWSALTGRRIVVLPEDHVPHTAHCNHKCANFGQGNSLGIFHTFQRSRSFLTLVPSSALNMILLLDYLISRRLAPSMHCSVLYDLLMTCDQTNIVCDCNSSLAITSSCCTNYSRAP